MANEVKMGEIVAERTCKHSAEMVLRTRVEKRMDAKEENEEKNKRQMFGETKRIIDFLNKHHLDTGRALMLLPFASTRTDRYARLSTQPKRMGFSSSSVYPRRPEKTIKSISIMSAYPWTIGPSLYQCPVSSWM